MKKVLVKEDQQYIREFIANALRRNGYEPVDELSEDDKLTVARARKIQRFLSQPFSVAEQFTGMEGRYVPIKETIRGFREILDGKHDSLPESAFLFVGTIDEAVEKAKKLAGEV